MQNLFKFLNEGLSFYIEKDILPDYYLFDYLLDIAYRYNINLMKDKIICLADNNSNAEDLSELMNLQYSKVKCEKIQQKTSIFKLSNKIKYSNVDELNEPTFYSKIFN